MDFSVSKDDISKLKHMYKTVFGETDRATNLFFDYMVALKDTFAVFEKGRLLSMSFGVRRSFKICGEAKSAVYICGVATRESERGRGLSKAIMNYMIDKYKDEGIDFLYLVPANPDLFSMYEKYGFFTAFYLNRQEADITADNAAKPAKTNICDLLQSYLAFGQGFNIFQQRRKPDFEFLLKDFSQNGGCLSYGRDGYMLYYISDKTAYIRESTICDGDLLRGGLGYLIKNFGVSKAVVTRPMQNNEEDSPYAMVLPLNMKKDVFLEDVGRILQT